MITWMQYSLEALNTFRDIHRVRPVLERIHRVPSEGMTHILPVFPIVRRKELQSLRFGPRMLPMQAPVPETCCMVIPCFLSPQEHWGGAFLVLKLYVPFTPIAS